MSQNLLAKYACNVQRYKRNTTGLIDPYVAHRNTPYNPRPRRSLSGHTAGHLGLGGQVIRR